MRIDHLDVSPDGRWMSFDAIEGVNRQLWLLSKETGEARRWLPTRFNQEQPRFSPDGRWIAFVSNDAGEAQVFVASSEGTGSKVQVSTTGGTAPVWSPKGGELFYSDRESLWAANVRRVDGGIDVGKPQRLLTLPERSHFEDVSPDGQRFLLLQLEPSPAPAAIGIVFGWLNDLEAKR